MMDLILIVFQFSDNKILTLFFSCFALLYIYIFVFKWKSNSVRVRFLIWHFFCFKVHFPSYFDDRRSSVYLFSVFVKQYIVLFSVFVNCVGIVPLHYIISIWMRTSALGTDHFTLEEGLWFFFHTKPKQKSNYFLFGHGKSVFFNKKKYRWKNTSSDYYCNFRSYK